LASPDFVNGNLEPTVTAVADIDVFNPTKPLLISFDAVKDWFRVAHDVKNDAYFALVPDSLVHQLTRGQ